GLLCLMLSMLPMFFGLLFVGAIFFFGVLPFVMTSDGHTVGSQFLQHVLVHACSWVMTAISINVNNPPAFNLNISSARHRAAGEDAGMANFRMRKLIEQVEIASGIHHVVVLIAVFAPGLGDRLPCVIVDESVLNHQAPFFALLGVQ